MAKLPRGLAGTQSNVDYSRHILCLPVSPNLPVPASVHGLILEPAHTYLYSTRVDQALKPDKCLRTGSRACLILVLLGRACMRHASVLSFPGTFSHLAGTKNIFLSLLAGMKGFLGPYLIISCKLM